MNDQKEQIKAALAEAEEGGADERELKKLKQMLSMNLPSATKKIITPEKRKAKQRAQKKARKAQRGKK